MKKKINYLILLLCFTSIAGYAQNIVSSLAYVQTCYNRHECFSIGNSSLIFLNQGTNEFIVQVDFSKFKIGNDTLDEWLVNLAESYFIFKGQLNPRNEIGLNYSILKPIIINGMIYFNGHKKPYSLQLMALGNAREGLQTMSNPNSIADLIYGSMHFTFNPKDFKIDSRHHHYKKTVSIAISKGYINGLTPEADKMIMDKTLIK